jgi:hypothetical protein
MTALKAKIDQVIGLVGHSNITTIATVTHPATVRIYFLDEVKQHFQRPRSIRPELHQQISYFHTPSPRIRLWSNYRDQERTRDATAKRALARAAKLSALKQSPAILQDLFRAIIANYSATI